MHQVKPMKWPRDRIVDWTDATERQTWIAEFREHLFDLFVVGFDATKSSRPRAEARREAQASLLANKETLDPMLHLGGAPKEPWKEVSFPLRSPPKLPDPPEITEGWPSPFKELPRGGWSAEEVAKWIGYVEGQLEYLVALLLVAYPEEREEHLRMRWAVIRLKVLFEKLRYALNMTSMRS